MVGFSTAISTRVQSPDVKEQYFKCLNMLRSGEEEMGDFYVEDACDWLIKPFGSLIAQLAPATTPLSVLTTSGRPTLSQYLFPQQVSFIVNATDNQLQPIRVDNQEYVWRASTLRLDDDFAKDLDQWTQFYHPSRIEVHYGCPQDVLIKPPTRVIVTGSDDRSVICFFKPFRASSRNPRADIELMTHRKIATAQIPPPPHIWICGIYGLVRDENGLLGMLFTWIDVRAVLSKGLAESSPAYLRRRWASQIDGSIKTLHQEGIIWGDAKAENVLIDKNDDAWVIDFGGSYTPGWVDLEKAGSLEGDMQGLGKIMDMLC
ncbi:hypothetical protein QBC33DRAFT_601445 [Phialemonium atrogriseum]|uniref:Protein kinase domain-containing protein n=1 Tax=Phialemonium atrogriseum TaxID=1093897 RepID=A0AAJ0FGP0_9PEZI|nr:uncharacterized protein QBC33DRAFT_601445 [Phialemonium atrogriseum]KAK1762553.1 hypothetical protein QBC33DRAFT_601445 [Phialemonium atrogriseum]